MMSAHTPLTHIVDDDEAIRDALAWLFKTRDVPCESWRSAEDFLDALDRRPPRLHRHGHPYGRHERAGLLE